MKERGRVLGSEWEVMDVMILLWYVIRVLLICSDPTCAGGRLYSEGALVDVILIMADSNRTLNTHFNFTDHMQITVWYWYW